jgi:DNA ligase 1
MRNPRYKAAEMLKRSIFFLLLLLAPTCPNAHALEIMLPLVHADGADISGWLMSEKLDGVRGYWDGRQLLSKSGKPLRPPPPFTANFPDFAMEGEIWGGRGTFEKTAGIVMKQEAHAGWLELKFAIFDVPAAEGGFEERLKIAARWFERHPSPHAFIIEHYPVEDNAHLQRELERIEKLGGEGIMLRRPGSPYSKGRSRDILKVKSYADMEAVVIAHLAGTGRNEGRMGSLLVELPGDGTRFKIGTGFSDRMRENPPPAGSLVTFKHYGFYESGIPKFPSFLRVREGF